jgi:hypothetical protein
VDVPAGGIAVVPVEPDPTPFGRPLSLFLDLIRGSTDSSFQWEGGRDRTLVRCHVETGAEVRSRRLRVTRLCVRGGRWPLVGVQISTDGEPQCDVRFPPLGREYPREGLGRIRNRKAPWERAWFCTNAQDLPPGGAPDTSTGFKTPSSHPDLDVARQIAINGFMAVCFEVSWATICDAITLLDVEKRSYSRAREYAVQFPPEARDDTRSPSASRVSNVVQAACGPPPPGTPIDPFALCRSLAFVPHRVVCLVGLGPGCGWMVNAAHEALRLLPLAEDKPPRTIVAQVPEAAVAETVARAERRGVPVGVARYGA